MRISALFIFMLLCIYVSMVVNICIHMSACTGVLGRCVLLVQSIHAILSENEWEKPKYYLTMS